MFKKFLAILFFLIAIFIIFYSFLLIIGEVSRGIYLDIINIFSFIWLLTGICFLVQGSLFWNNWHSRIITITLIVLAIITTLPLIIFWLMLAAGPGINIFPAG
jgi:hypothetical protein